MQINQKTVAVSGQLRLHIRELRPVSGIRKFNIRPDSALFQHPAKQGMNSGQSEIRRNKDHAPFAASDLRNSRAPVRITSKHASVLYGDPHTRFSGHIAFVNIMRLCPDRHAAFTGVIAKNPETEKTIEPGIAVTVKIHPQGIQRNDRRSAVFHILRKVAECFRLDNPRIGVQNQRILFRRRLENIPFAQHCRRSLMEQHPGKIRHVIPMILRKMSRQSPEIQERHQHGGFRFPAARGGQRDFADIRNFPVQLRHERTPRGIPMPDHHSGRPVHHVRPEQ